MSPILSINCPLVCTLVHVESWISWLCPIASKLLEPCPKEEQRRQRATVIGRPTTAVVWRLHVWPCFMYSFSWITCGLCIEKVYYVEGPSPVQSRLCGWSYLIKFSIRNLSYCPCSETHHAVFLPDVIYTMYARHPSTIHPPPLGRSILLFLYGFKDEKMTNPCRDKYNMSKLLFWGDNLVIYRYMLTLWDKYILYISTYSFGEMQYRYFWSTVCTVVQDWYKKYSLQYNY